mgnify:CR=1 FL=1
MEKANIDQFDIQILRTISKNGRISVQELSQIVGLSPSPVSRRLQLLEESNIITGYRALIDEGSLGFKITVFVSVQLDKQVDVALDEFEKTISELPEVVDCWLMTGNRDYLLRVVTGDLQDFEQFLTGNLTKIPGVSSIESSFPLRRVKSGITRTP